MSRFLKGVITAAAGAAIAYLFDPISGKTRRARLADQAAARGRDLVEEVETEVEYQAGKAKGAVHETLDPDTDVPVDDAELLQKVRSEAIGPSGVPTDGFEVHVDAGQVVVRGEVPAETDIDDLVERIRNVTGVRSVHTELERA